MCLRGCYQLYYLNVAFYNSFFFLFYIICTSIHKFGKEIWGKWPECNFKIFKNHEVDLSQIFPEPNMWLLFNHTKSNKHFVLKLMFFNSGQLQISYWLQSQLQNNFVNDVMLITISCVISCRNFFVFYKILTFHVHICFRLQTFL